MDKSIPDPPTAVLLHGILGSRKNWGTRAVLHRELVHFIYCYLYVLVVNHVTNKLLFSFFFGEGSFAKRLAQEFPMWQVIICIILMMV
jgi:hypothetical protein